MHFTPFSLHLHHRVVCEQADTFIAQRQHYPVREGGDSGCGLHRAILKFDPSSLKPSQLFSGYVPQQARFLLRRCELRTYSALGRYPTSNKSSYISSPSSRKKEAHFVPFFLPPSLTHHLTSERVPIRPLSLGKTAIRCRKLCSSLETTYFSGGGAVATAVSILRDENEAGSVKLKLKQKKTGPGQILFYLLKLVRRKLPCCL